jgi:hypothetical protein
MFTIVRYRLGLAQSSHNTADEASETPGCGFEALYQIATRRRPELVVVQVDVAGERRTNRLSAIDAMAMRPRSGRLDLETDAPALIMPKHQQPSPYRVIVIA